MIKKIIFSVTFLSYLVFVPVVFAAIDQINFGAAQPAGVKYAEPTNTPGNIISRAIEIIIFVGAVAVLFFILWGAFDWITSGGDKEKISSARKKITAALVGLALIALTFFIVRIFGLIVNFNPLGIVNIPTLGN